MSGLDDWVAAASAELGLTAADVPVGTVLDLARDVAHQVVRPGAPISAYLMGLAVGRGADPGEVSERLTALAASWPAPEAPQRPAAPARAIEARQSEARKSEARQSEARKSEARQSEARQSEARQTRAHHAEIRQSGSERIDPPIG